MKVLHISAECYPAAKAGGLGDVVGALPKYLTEAKVETGVIIPKYSLKWIHETEWVEVFKGVIRLHNSYVPFTIEQDKNYRLGIPFFVANIPGKFDRPGIYQDPGGYGYGDDVERWLCFQQAVLTWLVHSPHVDPKILHCHDHHTALIPFMVKHCPEYKALASRPTVLTIHNGQYHGSFHWDKMYLLPYFDVEARGLLDWMNVINPLACGIKCCWRLTTVSPGYLEELRQSSLGLESLLWHEQHKSLGIINGIDAAVWDPATDPRIHYHFDGKDVENYKWENKRVLAKRFNIDLQYPLFTFIGRLVTEKGADLLPDLIGKVYHSGIKASFVVLGTGMPYLHDIFRRMSHDLFNFFDTSLEYNETLAHQLYAGSDFLLMPSRVEPCGLNQMYSCRYGTVPIVRSVGGLKDTIPDIGEPDGSGRGIRFDQFELEDAFRAVYRGVQAYHSGDYFGKLRRHIMNSDFSWEHSVQKYIGMYQELDNLNQPAEVKSENVAIAKKPVVKRKPSVSKTSKVKNTTSKSSTSTVTKKAPAKRKPRNSTNTNPKSNES
ncbi:MAG: glycogen/starch synthase [Saprospiraceae bacterium]